MSLVDLRGKILLFHVNEYLNVDLDMVTFAFRYVRQLTAVCVRASGTLRLSEEADTGSKEGMVAQCAKLLHRALRSAEGWIGKPMILALICELSDMQDRCA